MARETKEGAVSTADVRGIARLARLRLEAPVIAALTGELNGILRHVRVLETLDLSELDEAESQVSRPVVPRDPELAPDALHADLASLSSEVREGFFTVPRLQALDQTDSGDSSA